MRKVTKKGGEGVGSFHSAVGFFSVTNSSFHSAMNKEDTLGDFNPLPISNYPKESC